MRKTWDLKVWSLCRKERYMEQFTSKCEKLFDNWSIQEVFEDVSTSELSLIPLF